jgi:hypothetical protein
MATSIVSNAESMQVKILRSMYIRGEFIAAGTVVLVSKRDGRDMIFQERAVPFVAQAEPAQAPAAPASGPADEVTAQSDAPIPSANSDETVGGAQPSADAQPAQPALESASPADSAPSTPAPAKRTRRAKAAPAGDAPAAE